MNWNFVVIVGLIVLLIGSAVVISGQHNKIVALEKKTCYSESDYRYCIDNLKIAVDGWKKSENRVCHSETEYQYCMEHWKYSAEHWVISAQNLVDCLTNK